MTYTGKEIRNELKNFIDPNTGIVNLSGMANQILHNFIPRTALMEWIEGRKKWATVAGEKYIKVSDLTAFITLEQER